jgi:hypothetical protein
VHSGPSTTDWITAIAAVVALLGAVATLFQTRTRDRIALTYRQLSQMNRPPFSDVLIESMSFLACREPPPGITPGDWAKLDLEERRQLQWKYFQELQRSTTFDERKKFFNIGALPNAIEDLAGLYNQNLLYRPIMKTHASVLVEGFWANAEWWVHLVTRATEDPNTYIELKKMLPDLRQQPRPRWHYPEDGPIKKDLISILAERPRIVMRAARPGEGDEAAGERRSAR